MQNIKILINNFRALDSDTQKNKVVTMLSQIKESSPVFFNFLNYINNTELISSDFLAMVYESIMQTAEEIGKADSKDFEKKINDFKCRMQEIYSAEKKDHEDAELILQSLM